MAQPAPSEAPQLSNEPLPKFPGMELFSVDQAAQLSTAIRDFTQMQPLAVRELCSSNNIGWKPDGFPDTLGVNKVERIVKTRACAALAIETARALSGELTSEQILDLVEKAGLDYKSIPQAVHAALATK